MPLGTGTLRFKETDADGNFVYEATVAESSDITTLTLKPTNVGGVPAQVIRVRVSEPTLGG